MFDLVQQLLLWISTRTKTPIEQIQFVFCMLLNIPLGAVYRTLLHPKNVSSKVRLLVSLTWGLIISWICFESETLKLIVVSTLCYGLTWSVNPKQVHKVVFVVSFACLLTAQFVRMFLDYGSNKFDYTGRLMIITQKVTYAAFSLYDGLGRKEDELTEDQKEQSIRRVPSLLEYFSYMFQHSTFLAGPVCTFNVYMDFIEGRDIARETKKGISKEPSPTKAVLGKLFSSLFCVAIFSVGSEVFPIQLNADSYFIANNSFLWRIWVSYFIMFSQRFKFYFAWLIADAGNNACGLGFNGYDSNGKELWNRVTNVNAFTVETSTNFRDIVQNWNIQTNLWLRRTVYDRFPHLPPLQRLMLTFTVSAMWHGFYPGYYLNFGFSAFFIAATRKVRRAYGHLFRSTSPVINTFVGILKWFFSNVVMATYCLTPFILLRLDHSLTYYRSMYFIGHVLILLLAASIFIPGRKPSHEAKVQ